VLREQYREIQSEPIPERLQDLIDALREIETNSSGQD
jgi:Anti-sigma factor NepR